MSGDRPTDPRFTASSFALLALALGLFCWAYWPLISFEPPASVEGEVEALLFTRSAAGPAVVLVLASWLFYRRWPRLRALDPARGSWAWALALVATTLPIYAWATHTGAHDLMVPAMMLDVLAFGAVVWGPPAFRVLWLPVAFLAFAMSMPAPLLNQVLWKFQIWTAQYTGFLLDRIGITNLVTGDQIIRAEQNYAIIEGCSGLRSVESLSMLTVLMIDLFRRRGAHAVILLVLSPLVAFALNGLRAITLILNPHSEIAEIHTIQGVSILLVGLLVLYGIDGLLERWTSSSSRRSPAPRRAAFELARPQQLFVGVSLAMLVAIWFSAPRWQPPARGVLPFPDGQISDRINGWSSTDLRTDRDFLGIVDFRARVDRRYVKGDDNVRLFVGVGGHRRSASPFSPKTGLPGSGWWVEDTRTLVLSPDRREVRARIVRYGNGSLRKLVLDWTEGALSLTRETLRAALALDTSRWSRDREGVALRLETTLDAATDEALADSEARLREFYTLLRSDFDTLGYPRGSSR